MRDSQISFDKDIAEIKKFLSGHLVLCRADVVQNGKNKGKLRQLFATTTDTFVVKLDGKVIKKKTCVVMTHVCLNGIRHLKWRAAPTTN